MERKAVRSFLFLLSISWRVASVDLAWLGLATFPTSYAAKARSKAPPGDSVIHHQTAPSSPRSLRGFSRAVFAMQPCSGYFLQRCTYTYSPLALHRALRYGTVNADGVRNSTSLLRLHSRRDLRDLFGIKSAWMSAVPDHGRSIPAPRPIQLCPVHSRSVHVQRGFQANK